MTLRREPNVTGGVAFDWDGTLCDSDFLLDSALETVLARYGCSRVLDEIEPHLYTLRPQMPLFRRVRLPAAQRDVIVRDIAADLQRRRARLALFPGIRSTLEALRSSRIPLFIVSGRDRDSLTRMLAAFGILGHFEMIVSGEDVPPKPDPAGLHIVARQLGVRRLIFVGNTDDDAAAAASASIPFLGVQFCLRTRKDVLRRSLVTDTSAEGLLNRLRSLLKSEDV